MRSEVKTIVEILPNGYTPAMLPELHRQSLLQWRLAEDSLRYAPELTLCVAIILLLLGRMVGLHRKIHLGLLPIIACVAGLGLLAVQFDDLFDTTKNPSAFGGLLIFDRYAQVFRGIILIASLITLILSRVTGLADRDDAADFGTFLLGATIGMMTMVSANHWLSLFLAVEMASLPSYILTGFMKGRPKASEAALKYVIFGAAASGMMLFGISLLIGITGSATLPGSIAQVAAQSKMWDLPLVAALLFIFAGLAFKLSAVPFHFWLPDAFEGAPAEVGGFLSVASKAAAVGLTGRMLILLADRGVPVFPSIGLAIAAVAALTVTVGTFMALPQVNLKRLLAYSTIAHAGLLMMGLATISRDGVSATIVYLGAYLLMNLGAFAVVALVRNATGSEDLGAYRGLMARSPVVGVAFAVFLFGLLGLPPLAGFAGKFVIFSAVYETGKAAGSAVAAYYYALLAVGIVNTAISAGIYLKVIKVMALDEWPDADVKEKFASPAGSLLVASLAVAVIALGIWWSPLLEIAKSAIQK